MWSDKDTVTSVVWSVVTGSSYGAQTCASTGVCRDQQRRTVYPLCQKLQKPLQNGPRSRDSLPACLFTRDHRTCTNTM
jgi:hypothetical protein